VSSVRPRSATPGKRRRSGWWNYAAGPQNRQDQQAEQKPRCRNAMGPRFSMGEFMSTVQIRPQRGQPRRQGDSGYL
jgi:hypothetical protein